MSEKLVRMFKIKDLEGGYHTIDLPALVYARTIRGTDMVFVRFIGSESFDEIKVKEPGKVLATIESAKETYHRQYDD